MPDPPTALDQFRPATLAREILAHPEGYSAGLVDWAKRVIEEEEGNAERADRTLHK